MAETLPPLVVAITADAKGITTATQQATKDVQKMVDETGGHTSRLSGMFSNLGPVITGVGVAVAGLSAVVGLKKIVDDNVQAFEDWAGSVKKLGRITGGSVEDVSGLAGAMKLVGLNAEDTTTAFTIFSKRIEAAQGDTEKTAELNEKLGTSFADASGKIKPMSELLPEVADKFKSMPDGVEKTALAAQLFGRSGTQLLPILNKGAAGIEELTNKAKDMGLVLDDASMKSFTDSKKAAREWDATMQGLQVTIGGALLPVIEGFKVTIQQFIIPLIQKASEYVKDHRHEFEELGKNIKDTLTPILKGLGDMLQNFIIPFLMGMGEWVSKNINWLLPLVGAVVALIAAFQAGMFIAGLIPIFQGLAAAMGILEVATLGETAAKWAENLAWLASPVTWIILGIVALIAAIVLLAMNWDAVVKWVSDVWEGFMGFLTDSFNNISKWWGDLWTGIGNAINDIWTGIVNWFTDAVTNVVNFVRDYWGLILSFFIGPLGLVIQFIVNNWSQIVEFFHDSLTNIGNFFTDAWNGILDFLSQMPGRIIGFFAGIGSWLFNAGRDLIQGLFDGINSLAGNIGRFFLDIIPDWIKEPFKLALGIASPSKVFSEYGVNIGDGLVQGMDKSMNKVKAATFNMSSSVSEAGRAGSEAVPVSSAVSTAAPVTQNITVNAQTNASPLQIASSVGWQLRLMG